MSNEMSLYDIDNLPDDYILESVYDIENLMVLINELSGNVSFLKNLKKHRNDQVDNKIGSLEAKSIKIRNIIIRTMQAYEPKKRTLSFPSVGRVTRTKSKEDIQIVDNVKAMNFFEENGVKSQVIRIKEEVDNTQFKKVCQNFIEQNITIPGVAVVAKPEGLTITFDKDNDEQKEQTVSERKGEACNPTQTMSADDL